MAVTPLGLVGDASYLSVNQKGSQGMVVDEGVSRFGLHRLHVVRAGSPVEAETYLERLEGSEAATRFEYLEEEIGMWHLRLWWRPAKASNPASSPGGGDGGE